MTANRRRGACTGPPHRIARWWRGDTGNMPLALLISVVGMTLSGSLVSMLVGQVATTRLEDRRSNALHAAQSGIDVAWAHLSRSTTASSLPCGSLSGSVLPAGTPGTATYDVRIDYFSSDPQPLTEAQLPHPPPGPPAGWVAPAGLMACPLTASPRYALLRSTGKEATGTERRLRATYVFQLKHVNVPGGQIKQLGGVCLDAGPTPGSLPAGTDLTVVPCDPAKPDRQMFAYNSDLSVSLTAPAKSFTPNSLCMWTSSSPGTRAKMRPCVKPPPVEQRWTRNGYHNFLRPTVNCLTAKVQGLVTYAEIGSRCGGSSEEEEKWRPEASVGAGAAGAGTGQLVNFKQFGRCLDLHAKLYVHTSGHSATAYNCTDATQPGNWNQIWNPPTLPKPPSTAVSVGGRLSVDQDPLDTPVRNPGNNVPHCLTSLGQHDSYVFVTRCSQLDTRSYWTFYGENASYEEKYTIVDYTNNLCLAARPLSPANEVNNTAASVVVATCDGSELQKWNAPPYLKPAQPLKDVSER